MPGAPSSVIVPNISTFQVYSDAIHRPMRLLGGDAWEHVSSKTLRVLSWPIKLPIGRVQPLTMSEFCARLAKDWGAEGKGKGERMGVEDPAKKEEKQRKKDGKRRKDHAGFSLPCTLK